MQVTSKTVESPYLIAEEAASYIRTTVQGVYALVKRGRIKPMPGRPGRLLFTREALDSYLKGKFRG
jgi:excisionase family DNA binding protein